MKKRFNEPNEDGFTKGNSRLARKPKPRKKRRKTANRKETTNIRYLVANRRIIEKFNNQSLYLMAEPALKEEPHEVVISEANKEAIKKFLDNKGTGKEKEKSISKVVDDYHIPFQKAEEIYNEWRKEWCSTTKAI